MDRAQFSERDICTRLITPAIQQAGSSTSSVRDLPEFAQIIIAGILYHKTFTR